MIQATVGGVLLGILYIATGRNLIAPIVAHGLGNSIDFTVMYLGSTRRQITKGTFTFTFGPFG